MLVAAAEFLLLAEATHSILHTRGSSFAREAASVFGRAAVVDVAETVEGAPLFFYTQHKDLPDCAMPEFIRSSYKSNDPVRHSSEEAAFLPVSAGGLYAPTEKVTQNKSEWPRVCYREDSGTNVREMCSVQHTVCLCGTLTGSSSGHTASNNGNFDNGCNNNTCSQSNPNTLHFAHCVVSAEHYKNMTVDFRLQSCVPVLAESNGYSL